MNSHRPHPITEKHGLAARVAFAALLLGLAAASTVGCDSGDQPGRSLRADLVAIRTAHGDTEAIGSLDAEQPVRHLNQHRRPAYRTVANR